MENSLVVPQKVKHRVIYDRTIELLSIDPKEMKTLCPIKLVYECS